MSIFYIYAQHNVKQRVNGRGVGARGDIDLFCLLNRNDQSSLTMSRDVGDTGTVPKTMYEHAMQPDCPKIPYSLLQTATGRDRNFRILQ